MANRLTKITTRTGDDGTTGLGDGTRVSKDHTRIIALGDVDELNCILGLLLCESFNETIKKHITQVQHDLFDLGGELSIPGHILIQPSQLQQLDQWIEQYNATLPTLKEFILPGGTTAASLAHIARSVCRRAERSLITLAKTDTTNTTSHQYLNRLSDLLFILARAINQQAEVGDILWQRKTKPAENS